MSTFDVPEGTRALVPLLIDDKAEFWQAVSLQSKNEVWDNTEDDFYAEGNSTDH